MKLININVPPQFNIILLKKNKKKNKNLKINIYNKNIWFKIIIFKKINIFINKKNNFIKINNLNIINNKKLITNKLNNFLKFLYIYNFIKIKFKGKGFKLGFYKKKKY